MADKESVHTPANSVCEGTSREACEVQGQYLHVSNAVILTHLGTPHPFKIAFSLEIHLFIFSGGRSLPFKVG